MAGIRVLKNTIYEKIGMIRSKIWTHQVVWSLMLLSSCLTVVIFSNSYRIPFSQLGIDLHVDCFEWQPTDHRVSTTHRCPYYSEINSFVWTYDGTGIMKYIQWISTRKLGNIRITRLNEDCYIIQENYFSSSNSTDKMFVQVYILPLFVDFIDKSKCSRKINKIAAVTVRHINNIYFKRKSIKATVGFQQLDLMVHNDNFTFDLNASSLEIHFKRANYTVNWFSSYFASNHWKFIDSEDLIKADLNKCEKVLTNFISLLGLKTVAQIIKNTIEYDSHNFIDDATWWDQSEVVEHTLNMSISPRPSKFTYSNDFYYLHGDRPFIQYLFQSRRCYHQGSFAQTQSETITNRPSTDEPERCSSKPFDCAFSDIYSFSDREQIYQQFDSQNYFDPKSIKCGFTFPSILDKVRSRYARNQTCQTIIFTSIINCYDPLPGVGSEVLPSFCFVALLDTKTKDAYKKIYITKSNVEWDIIDLGVNATPFAFPVKSIETLKIVGQRMFPLAKWIIWLDGKANIHTISELLLQARAPVIGAHHPDGTRTSASEIAQTVIRMTHKYQAFPEQLNPTLRDILLQEKEYQRDGFYNRSDALKLPMYDIAVFLYRNNHPCIFRYLCGWHNEVNYYSFRGQLSVYYAAARLDLTDYLHFLPDRFYRTWDHRTVC